jgi:hypothetical protein
MTAAMSDAVTSGYDGRGIWGALIGGVFTEAADAETFAVTEPATGRPIARVVSGGTDLVDKAVTEARRVPVVAGHPTPRTRQAAAASGREDPSPRGGTGGTRGQGGRQTTP